MLKSTEERDSWVLWFFNSVSHVLFILLGWFYRLKVSGHKGIDFIGDILEKSSCVCTRLNGFKYCSLAQIIVSNITHSFTQMFQVLLCNINDSNIIPIIYLLIVKWLHSWPIDETLTGNTTPNQSGPGSNGNEWVFYIYQNFMTEASQPDCLAS